MLLSQHVLLLDLIDGDNCKNVVLHCKSDVVAGESNAVNPIRLSLVRGAGIVAENTDGGGLFAFRQQV